MMLPSISAQDFVAKWSKATLKESAASQEHFIDICHLVGHPTPAEADHTGDTFTFEKGASKQSGGEGWADVWKRDFFAWEYKGKHKDLNQAYQQLLQYRESLQNPFLLVVSDMEKIVIHTNFSNTVKKVVTIELNDLLKPEGIAKLSVIFFEPEKFRVPQTTEQVTQQAAAEFARLADLLPKYGSDHQQAAHFLIRLLFCLFAESCSEPRRIEVKYEFEDFKVELLSKLQQSGKVALQLDNLSKLANKIATISRKRLDIPLEVQESTRKELKERHPLAQIAFYAHTYLDTQLFIVHESSTNNV